MGVMDDDGDDGGDELDDDERQKGIHVVSVSSLSCTSDSGTKSSPEFPIISMHVLNQLFQVH